MCYPAGSQCEPEVWLSVRAPPAASPAESCGQITGGRRRGTRWCLCSCSLRSVGRLSSCRACNLRCLPLLRLHGPGTLAVPLHQTPGAPWPPCLLVPGSVPCYRGWELCRRQMAGVASGCMHADLTRGRGREDRVARADEHQQRVPYLDKTATGRGGELLTVARDRGGHVRGAQQQPVHRQARPERPRPSARAPSGFI